MASTTRAVNNRSIRFMVCTSWGGKIAVAAADFHLPALIIDQDFAQFRNRREMSDILVHAFVANFFARA